MAFKPHPQAEERVRSAKTAIEALLALDIYPSHKRELLSICLWKLTEAEARGKYNLRFQTPAALEASPRELQHEQVVERKRVVEALMAEPDRLEEILRDVVGCAVTREEHQRLTQLSRERPDLEGWARYEAAGITVIDLVTGEKQVGS